MAIIVLSPLTERWNRHKCHHPLQFIRALPFTQNIGRAPLCHISFVDIWICHCVFGLGNVFIIGFYYKQHWLVLKNEVKKTTTRPWRPSGPKWTTHRVPAKLVHKGHITMHTNGKQAHHPTSVCRLSVSRPRRCCPVVLEKCFYFLFLFNMFSCSHSCESRTETNTNFVVWIFSS